jgi:hypothetical protein
VDGNSWFGPRYPKDVCELKVAMLGVVTDTEKLRALFDLFAVCLEQMSAVGISVAEYPGVEL